MSWQDVLVGLAVGVVATLIAGSPYVRFHVEKFFRKLLGRPLISATLSAFINFCSDGWLLIYCMELRNAMWLTTRIPKVYLMSRGDLEHNSYAYKPFIYFRSHGGFGIKTKSINRLLEEYSSNIVPYMPDNPNLSLTLSKVMPYRVVFLCEFIDKAILEQNQPLNNVNIVGELRAAVANPMPLVCLGASWDIRVISEDFGLIDIFRVSIPEDLRTRQPLGDSAEVLRMTERPACLLDLGYEMMSLTWPLRFEIDNCRIVVKSRGPRTIKVMRPAKKVHGFDIKGAPKRSQLYYLRRGIRIQ